MCLPTVCRNLKQIPWENEEEEGSKTGGWKGEQPPQVGDGSLATQDKGLGGVVSSKGFCSRQKQSLRGFQRSFSFPFIGVLCWSYKPSK